MLNNVESFVYLWYLVDYLGPTFEMDYCMYFKMIDFWLRTKGKYDGEFSVEIYKIN